jgi:hypothetical protein
MVKPRSDYVTRFKSNGVGTKSGQKPISVLLPAEIDGRVRSLSNRSAWLREAIAEKLTREGLMQSKTVEIEIMDREDKDWLESDLSHFSEIEPYDWGDADPQLIGKPIRYEQGVGFVIEGEKESGQ